MLRNLVFLVAFCCAVCAQTQSTIASSTATPSADQAKSGDIGGGIYVANTFDSGRYLLETVISPPVTTLFSIVIAARRLPPAATLTKSGDIGSGIYVADVFASGQWLLTKVVWVGQGGNPQTPPRTDGINNPLSFH